jgi:hypothetical protein
MPVPQVTVVAEHWAVLEAVEGVSPVRVDRRLAEDSRLAASPSPLVVFRPPR